MTESADSTPLPQATAVSLYEIAVDEYRFEVGLNWQRSQYLLALNAAIISVATGLLNAEASPERTFLTGCVFVIGLFAAGVSLLAHTTQREYYRAARDRMRAVAEELGLSAWSVETTPGMGGSAVRLVRVTTAISVLFGVMAVIDAAGLVIAARRSLGLLGIVAGLAVVALGVALAWSAGRDGASRPAWPRSAAACIVAGAVLAGGGAFAHLRSDGVPASVSQATCVAKKGAVSYSATIKSTSDGQTRRLFVRVLTADRRWLAERRLAVPRLRKGESLDVKFEAAATVDPKTPLRCRATTA